MTSWNPMFQKIILFGRTVLASLTTPLWSRTIRSIGNRKKKVWIPNLVLKTIVSASFFPKSPFIFPRAFLKEYCLASTVF